MKSKFLLLLLVLISLVGWPAGEVEAFFNYSDTAVFSLNVADWMAPRVELRVSTGEQDRVVTELIGNPNFDQGLADWQVLGQVQPLHFETAMVELGGVQESVLSQELDIPEGQSNLLIFRYNLVSTDEELFDQPALQVKLNGQAVWYSNEWPVSDWQLGIIELAGYNGPTLLEFMLQPRPDTQLETVVYLSQVSTAGAVLGPGDSLQFITNEPATVTATYQTVDGHNHYQTASNLELTLSDQVVADSFQYWATDAAGNSSQKYQPRLVIDQQPPASIEQLELFTETDGSKTFSFTVPDDLPLGRLKSYQLEYLDSVGNWLPLVVNQVTPFFTTSNLSSLSNQQLLLRSDQVPSDILAVRARAVDWAGQTGYWKELIL